MHHAILPAALDLAGASSLAAYVALRREKTDLHWLLLAVLGSLMIWTTGTICRFSVSSRPGLVASLHLVFFGVFAIPPLWVLLAARCARVRSLFDRREVYVALAIPSALAYFALLTNEGHRLVIREVSFAALERGAHAWAGPVFYAFTVWAYALIAGSVAIYLREVRRMLANEDRRRAFALTLAAVIPVAASSVYVFGWLPVTFDLTPSGFVVTLVLLSAAVFRYQVLERLPLARRDVIEHLQDGVVLASADGTILDQNPSAVRILGIDAAKLRRATLAGVLCQLADGDEADALRAALEDGDPGAPPLLREISTRDERQIEIFAAWGRDGGNEPAGRFAVLRDRTEERRFERMLRQTQKFETVGTLAAGIAHEVNNPLAFIRANLTHIQRLGERIEQERDGPHAKLVAELDDLAEVAAETLDGIARIEKIVADMRHLSKSQDDQDLRQEGMVPLEVNEALEDALRLANLRRGGRIAIETRFAEPSPRVLGAPERLVQALLNLLVNAAQALSDVSGARIELETRIEGGDAVLRVRDNGPGIPEAIQERIFDPFFTTKGPDQGTGLGLAIAFDIVRAHGGLLDLRSRPAEGACFTLRIPAC